MASDDSEHEEETILSEEEVASDDDESYEKAESTDDSESNNKTDDAPDNEPTGPKPGVLPSRPPRPPGTRFPRPGARRPSLGLSLPVPPLRPSAHRLRMNGGDDDHKGDDHDDDDDTPSEAELQRRREENIRALLNNSLQTCRQPLLSKFLSVMESQVVLRKPFQSPLQGAPRMSDALRRKLAARRHFVPWGSSTPLPIPTMNPKLQPPVTPTVPELPPEAPAPPLPPAEPELPEGIEPLVLWQAPPGAGLAGGGAESIPTSPGDSGSDMSVVVDNMLVRFLRPHQREGVQFMFDCVTGQRLEGKQGCILADDMGLGKTLQGITLLWTLLTSGHPLLGGCPIARRAIIVCPTSLVSNWDNECTKWLQGRLKTLAMCESSREDVVANIGLFLHPSNAYKVLIVSYETFRMHAERFQVPHACDLLICDEAHRLKNDATLTNRALDNLSCKRRVLLSGTPMQNHLDEFFAMVDFCNPGVLGPPAQFRKYYELPILAGREPDAAPEEAVLGEERSRELSGLTNNFILRRTNKLLSQHLPPKVIEVVCCRLTELQRQLYSHFLQSKAARRVLNGRTASGVLSAITALKKLCNHPKLIYDSVHSKAAAMAGGGGGHGGEDGEHGRADGFEDVGCLFPPGLFDNGRVGRGGMAAGWEAVSGKMAVLARMLHVLYTETNDRIVLVSNYTSTLDLFAHLCRERGYPFVRLDGTTTINKRQKLVKVFNDPSERQFAFLLSSKAGGCGLNLIGGNRLVLFDPDWNPANDQQAAARVWRDGQRKRVFVYRFLSTGSIEEKVYQRQLSKEGLKQLVSKNGKAAANVMTTEDLRELFTLNADTWSDTYDYMCGGPGLVAAADSPSAAKGGPIDLAGNEYGDVAAPQGGRRGSGPGALALASAAPVGGVGVGGPGRLPPVHKGQSGEPAEEDLANWGHHPNPETVPDAVMRRVAAPDVSFIFSCSVAGKAIEGGDEEERRLTDAAADGGGGGGDAGGKPVTAARVGSGMRGGGGGSSRGLGTRTAGRPSLPDGNGGGGAGTLGCRTPAAPHTVAKSSVAATLPLSVAPAPATSVSGSSVQAHTARTPGAADPAVAVSTAAQAMAPPPPTTTPTSSVAAATPAALIVASKPAVSEPPGGSNRPQPQPQVQLQQNVPSTIRPACQKSASVAAGGSGGGSSSRTFSCVTGALTSSGSVPPSDSGTNRRLPADTTTSAADTKPPPGLPLGPREGGMAAQPLRSSAELTNPQPGNPQPQPPATELGAAAAAAMQGAASRSARSTGSTGLTAAAVAAAVPGAAAPAAMVSVQSGDPKGGGARSRAVMEAASGAVLEAPKSKRKRAPGWYINDSDDDFL